MHLVLLFALVLQFVASHNLPEYTNDDFDDRIKHKKFTLVMFYAPWCGHCKRLKPDFISAGEKLADNKEVGFALVDCTTQDKICSRFGVSGYPTLKFFKDGQFFMEYDGPRDENGLMKFALTRSQPPSHELKDKGQLAEVLDNAAANGDPVVVSVIKPGDEKVSELHNNLASDLVGLVLFAHTDTANLLDAGDKSLIRLYRPKRLVTKLTEAYVDYDGKMDAASLRVWILNKAHGLVGYRCLNNQKLFPHDNIMLFYHNDSIDKYPKGVNYHRNRLTQAIKDSGISQSKLTFVYSYSEDFYHEINQLQSSGPEDYPIVLIKSAGKKYKLEEYSREKLVNFLKAFEDGKLEPFIKSEPIPSEQPSAAIKVVARNFDAVVNDPSKDVFIMFHAPWCGHCKQLMPKYEAVAAKLKAESNLLMVTFDATANDIPHPFEVQGYPTLYFSPKSSKHSPKRYEGQREEDDLIKFIAKESTEELQGYDRDGKVKKTDL